MTAKKIRSQPFDHSIVFGAESANKSGVFISKAALKQIKKEETSLLFGEVSSGLKTYRCFSLIWQITLIWIPMHLLCFPGCILAQGGVHFSASGVQITVGRGALWRRRGAFSEGGGASSHIVLCAVNHFSLRRGFSNYKRKAIENLFFRVYHQL